MIITNKQLEQILNEELDNVLNRFSKDYGSYGQQESPEEEAMFTLVDSTTEPEGSVTKFGVGIEWAVIAPALKLIAVWLGVQFSDMFVDYIKERGMDYALRKLAIRIFTKYMEDPDRRLWGENTKLLRRLQGLRPKRDMLERLDEQQKDSFITEVTRLIELDTTEPFDIDTNKILEEMFPEIFAAAALEEMINEELDEPEEEPEEEPEKENIPRASYGAADPVSMPGDDPRRAQGTPMTNAALLKKIGNSKIARFFEIKGWPYNNLADVARFFKEIPPLNSHKLTKVLGMGKNGIVFGLDNGHALKLFGRGFLPGSGSPGAEEMGFYASEKEKLFSKSAGRHTLPIYDSGTVDGRRIRPTMPPQPAPPGRSRSTSSVVSPPPRRPQPPPGLSLAVPPPVSVNWVEMANLVPLMTGNTGAPEYFIRTGRTKKKPSYDYDYSTYSGSYRENIMELLSAMKMVIRQHKAMEQAINTLGKNREDPTVLAKRDRVEFFLKDVKKFAMELGMTTKEVASLFQTLKAVSDEYGQGYLTDLHGGNIGIIETSVNTENPAFVLFDP